MSLTSISPVDGRYSEKVSELGGYFSEYGLIRFRLEIELFYFIELVELNLPELADFAKEKIKILRDWVNQFEIVQAEEIKQIEKTTNHDIKALEYWIKSKFDEIGIGAAILPIANKSLASLYKPTVVTYGENSEPEIDPVAKSFNIP